jgi:hypothetical protein
MGIADKCAGQEACFRNNLEAIADTQNFESLQSLGANVCHDGRTRRDGAAAEVVAVGKTAGNDDEVNLRQFRIRVPDGNGGNACDCLKGQHHIAFAIDPGEYDDG